MFEIAFLLGIYSYIIFFFGLLGILFRPLVIVVSLVFWSGAAWYYKNNLKKSAGLFANYLQNTSLFERVCLGILLLQILVNLLGVFGPELGFDALWYHVTLPKLYLLYHSVLHIPGGLLYYSDMPKLIEMVYTGALSFQAVFLAKSVQWISGILCCIVLYRLSRLFVSQKLSLLAVVIFYSNLVVGWESTSAYIDLSWTFFILLSFYSFLEWRKTKENIWVKRLGLIMGLAIATKLVSGGIVVLLGSALWMSTRKTQKIQTVGRYLLLSLLVPLPWFVFSFIHTGNPVYPLFTSTYPINNYLSLFNPLIIIRNTWQLFLQSPDPLTPVYAAILPLLFIFHKKLLQDYKEIILLSLGGFVVWYLTPQTGGGRFALPFLPLWSLCSVCVIENLVLWKKQLLVGFMLLTCMVAIGYRGLANAKILPLLLGKQTQSQYLTSRLNFSFGDFYDVDGYFAKHIKPTDTVLLYGFHNLYYVDFPFIDSSWAKKGDGFTYVAVQGKGLPERFRYWNLVYFNNTTQVRLYSLGKRIWVY